ncbi:MAG TPA: hypothetical protein DD670_13040 [Planctomycetaceae bacterium]|nr:hypothetical protein [Planctomycetaceae bacterium]
MDRRLLTFGLAWDTITSRGLLPSCLLAPAELAFGVPCPASLLEGRLVRGGDHGRAASLEQLVGTSLLSR